MRSCSRRYVFASSGSLDIFPSAIDGNERACSVMADVRLEAKREGEEASSDGRQGQACFEARYWLSIPVAEYSGLPCVSASLAAASAWSLPRIPLCDLTF